MDKLLCEGRTCVVTGAGRGVGRAHALLLARLGASVVVNDLGATVRGQQGGDEDPAATVVAEIEARGGRAIASHHDVSSWGGAEELVGSAIDTFGQLDVVVNNAGILRDRTIVKMEEGDWDSVQAVHTKGTFQVSRWAALHWRERTQAGDAVDARVINTTSASGLYGNPGQGNYAAAKAGIAAFTLVASQELARYGATANAIAPAAMTRMTEGLPLANSIGADTLDPEWVAPLVGWLASPLSADVTGRVFEVSGQQVAVCEGWSRGPSAPPPAEAAEVDATVRILLAQARPNANILGAVPEAASLGGVS